jgi:hypothetical protein
MKARIASLYFAPLHADRSAYGGIYDIPAVPKGAEPFILTVTDMVQRWYGPYDEGHKLISRMIPGELIAEDILAHWTKMGLGMTPTCHPGAWLVRDKMPAIGEDGKPVMEFDGEGRNKPQWREATKEEFAAMWAEDLKANKEADANWAEYLMGQANIKAEDPKQVPYIDHRAKRAAKHYGREFPWLHDLKDSETTQCPYCTKLVFSAAAVCPFCHNVVNAEKYAALEAAKQKAIEAAMSRPTVKPQFPSKAHA